MITRSKLVEQLRDYQIRSQHKCSPLTVFSPKPHISTWGDVASSIFFAILFSILVVLSYVALYIRYFWFSFVLVFVAILLPICLRVSRQAIARKRERRLWLPLSM